MSEHITHIAVAEDSARIASIDPAFSKRLLACIEKHPMAFRFGSTTRSGDNFIFPFLEKWKKDWKNDDPRSEKMSYILGWSGHLAADRTFKPVYRLTNLDHYMDERPSPTDASVYHDIITFGKVFQQGKTSPFHPSILENDLNGHPGADYVPVSRLENAYAGNLCANLAVRKTYLPKDAQKVLEDWDGIESQTQAFYVDMDRYIAAYNETDASLMKQMIIDPNFYDEVDPIIQLARSVQNNESPKFSLEEALEQADQQSLYAQSLKLGHQFLMADSDFFEGKTSLEEAAKRHRRFERHKQKLKYYIELAEKNKMNK